MLLTYWNIGKRIVEQELGGSERAAYGRNLISALADDLTKEFGKNYSKRNLHYYIKFYQCFPDEQIVNACVHNLNALHTYYTACNRYVVHEIVVACILFLKKES